MLMRLCAVVVLACSTSGCGGRSNTDSNQTFRVDSLSSGLIQVMNDGRGLWTSDTRWTLEEDLRLGSVDGGGGDQFNQIAWIDEDSDGFVYVLDFPSQEVRVFRPDGTYSHRIGRRGEGPGELIGAAGLNFAPDGNLWVWSTTRYSVFEPDGTFLDSWPRLVRGVAYPWRGGFTGGGDLIDWGFDRERRANPNETTGRASFYPVRFTPPNQYDTMPALRYEAWMRAPGEMMYGTNRRIMFALTKSEEIWFAHTDRYELLKRSLPGDTLVRASLPASPRIITDAEIDSVIQGFVQDGFPERLAPEDFIRQRRLVVGITVDERGYVYVLPQTADLAAGTVVDVFRGDGVYLGRLDLPTPVLTESPAPFVTRGRLYAVTLDELDVPYVVRWRIVQEPLRTSSRGVRTRRRRSSSR